MCRIGTESRCRARDGESVKIDRGGPRCTMARKKWFKMEIESLFHEPEIKSAMEWLDAQQPAMLALVQDLCEMNSGTFNARGVERVVERLYREYAGDQVGAEYSALGDLREIRPTPPARMVNDQGQEEVFELGPHLVVEARPERDQQIFLCIHTDTVYDLAHPFQHCRFLPNGHLNGPGVIDAKGGLVVLLFALRAFERTSWARELGWKVLLNPDEEIGSLGSQGVLKEISQRCRLGLLFEPVLPDGALVQSRKGAGNFTLVCRGKSAHSGRDFQAGRNAVVHLSRCVAEMDQLNQLGIGNATINVGRFVGGGPVNMVPDLAVARLNVRVSDPAEADEVMLKIRDVLRRYQSDPDYQVTMEGEFTSPPKVLDAAGHRIQRRIEEVGKPLGVPIHWRPSGGASDGNKLSGFGVPNIDTLGPVGDHLHSANEYLVVESLSQRAKLTAGLLLSFARAPL